MYEMGNLLFGHSRGDFGLANRDLAHCKEWLRLLAAAETDSYGYTESKNCANNRGGFENEVFAITPYWWGDGADETECNRPNFLYKPTGFEIRWYKYPFRDSYMNQNLDDKALKEIWAACAISIEERWKCSLL